MIERGTVVGVRGNRVDVVLGNSSACSGCTACSMGDTGEMLLRDVADEAGAAAGDEVEVFIPESLRLQAALAVYGVPLAGLIFGYLAGVLLGKALGSDPDITGAIVGVLAATAALAGTQIRERSLARNGRYAPRVRAIISRGSERG
ncbi:MAG: SoxR reducing system RseC family protein [Actinomycetota bacterium]|nr:SoxR reducing system RseC family protein [Actinomycetota bacterium]